MTPKDDATLDSEASRGEGGGAMFLRFTVLPFLVGSGELAVDSGKAI